MILSRQIWRPFVDRVARSAEEARRGSFVANLVAGEMYSEEEANRIPTVVIGASPDPSQFVILAPGETHQTEMTRALPVGRKGSNLDEAIKSDSQYVYQTDVELWPFRMTPEDEIAKLYWSWRSVGELVVDSAATNLVPLRTPTAGRIAACPPSRLHHESR